jgi:hypothetical protein
MKTNSEGSKTVAPFKSRNELIIGLPRKQQIRQGWEKEFKRASEPGDPLLLPEAPNAFDQEEWEW